jgi:cell wall-associated NlpC family hydrolase
LKINANLTLRICLAAVAILLFAGSGSQASKGNHTNIQKKNHSVSATRYAKRSTSPKKSKVSAQKRQQNAPEMRTACGRAILDDLAVRQDEEVIAVLNRGDTFTVIGRHDNKFQVRLDDGREGFVHTGGVSLDDGGEPLPAGDRYSTGSSVVRVAYAYRGARYRSGGSSASGFDCSGFVKFVYASHGIKLPHSSRAMFNYGTPVAKSNLKPGDLVFFSYGRRGISHVGIYAGSGKFIHASTHSTGVRVDSLNSYHRRYVGARRL